MIPKKQISEPGPNDDKFVEVVFRVSCMKVVESQPLSCVTLRRLLSAQPVLSIERWVSIAVWAREGGTRQL